MSVTVRERSAAPVAFLVMAAALALCAALPGGASAAGGSPLGHVDHISGGMGGFLQVVGWTFDPDAPSEPGGIQVSIDGPAGSGARSVAVTADVHRPDVADAFPGVAAAHGFSAAIPGVAPGRHEVFVYSVNRAGDGTNGLIRTATVDVPATPAGSPFGYFDEAFSVPLGASVRGWTADPDAMQAPTEVHVYVDGPAGTGARGISLGAATASRPDVAAAVPGAGAAHGYERAIADLPPGNHALWVYAINAAGPGGNPLLGSRVVKTGDPVAGQPADVPEQDGPGQVTAPPPSLKTMGATVSYAFFPQRPRRSTRFSGFRVGNVPAGSTVTGRCLTAAGRPCRGRLRPGFLKAGARGSLRVRAFDRRYPAGTRIEVLISNPAYRSQIKTVFVRANRRPRIATRCQTPGTTKRGPC